MISCPDHPEAVLIEDYRAGDQICSACGLVVGDRVIDVGSEWRTFSTNNGTNKPDQCRVGAAENPLLNDGNLGTCVGPSTSGPAYGKPGAGLANDSIATYRNRSSVAASDRYLLRCFGEIRDMGEKLSLPQSVLDRANIILKEALTRKGLKGRNASAITGAALYIACRSEAVPRTFKEIVAVSATCKKDIGRCFKIILKNLDTNIEVVTVQEYMARFCSNLDLERKIQMAAIHVANTATELDLVCGRSPVSVAAGSIFLVSQVSNNPKTEFEVGEIAGVSESTIRLLYRLLLPHAKKLFPKDYKFFKSIESL